MWICKNIKILTAIWGWIYSLHPTKISFCLGARLLASLRNCTGRVSGLLEWSLSSSALPLALTVTPHVDAGLNTIKCRKRCQICVSEVAVLVLFSEQGEQLLARNAEAFLSKLAVLNFQNY